MVKAVGSLLCIAMTNRASLVVITCEKSRASPSVESCLQSPRQLDGVGHAGVHTKSASGTEQVRRVTSKETTTFGVSLGDQSVGIPRLDRVHVDIEVSADHILDYLDGVDILPVLTFVENQVIGIGLIVVPRKHETTVVLMQREENIAVPEWVLVDHVWRSEVDGHE